MHSGVHAHLLAAQLLEAVRADAMHTLCYSGIASVCCISRMHKTACTRVRLAVPSSILEPWSVLTCNILELETGALYRILSPLQKLWLHRPQLIS